MEKPVAALHGIHRSKSGAGWVRLSQVCFVREERADGNIRSRALQERNARRFMSRIGTASHVSLCVSRCGRVIPVALRRGTSGNARGGMVFVAASSVRVRHSSERHGNVRLWGPEV